MQDTEFKSLFRHITACNTGLLPGKRLPLRAANKFVGWIEPDLLSILYEMGVSRDQDGIDTLSSDHSLENLGKMLTDKQITQSMHELFDVYPSPHEKPIGKIDRSILPLLGMIGTGVHLNGLVQKNNEIYLWVGERSLNKRLDAGKLDHIVAGGIPAGYTHKEALVKEANEEANLSSDLIQQAKYVGMITYSMLRPEGLRRDVLYCYDLWLPEDFQPTPNDGEVKAFHLMKLKEVFKRACQTDDIKFNVNLVLIDLFLRHGLIPKNTSFAQQLRQGLRGKLFP